MIVATVNPGVSRTAIRDAPLGGWFKKGEFAEAIGRSRGGRTSQIHALADDRGRPVARRRHHHGRSIAWSRRQTKAAAGRQSLRRRQPAQMAQTKEGQSSRSIHSLTPHALSSGQHGLQMDSTAYKRRNLIERMFCKLKNWRRIATRYDRYAQNDLSGLALAAIMIAWI